VSLLETLHLRRQRKASPLVISEDDERVNPVAFTIQQCKDRTRGKLAEGMVERRAKELHADSSFAPWTGLSEVDKELWCHLARLELLGDRPPSP
jgi:hypothetical protein